MSLSPVLAQSDANVLFGIGGVDDPSVGTQRKSIAATIFPCFIGRAVAIPIDTAACRCTPSMMHSSTDANVVTFVLGAMHPAESLSGVSKFVHIHKNIVTFIYA